MKKTFTIGFAAMLALSAFAYGCGDDDDPPNNPGGSAGTGGSGTGGSGTGGSGTGGSGTGGGGGTGGGSGGLSAAENLKLRSDMHAAIAAETVALKSAAEGLCAAAPADAAGWQDAAKVDAMKAEWVKTRGPYERIEGVIAPLFPDTDAAIDERYDGFIEEAGAPDPNPFDDQIVTGMHAIERILYHQGAADALAEEKAALGANYTEPSYPADATQASDFKNKLCAKLVVDTGTLVTEWAALKRPDGTLGFDLGAAYQGLLDLVAEQQEKINNASTQLDESRYAKRTMVDIRDNLTGVKNVYALFSPRLQARPNPADPDHDGPAIDAKIQASLGRLQAAYDAVSGDQMPAAPDDWSAENPTPANLMTDFGKLYKAVSDEVDPANEASAAHGLEEAAALLGVALPSGG
ncbi:MAG TPA: imelysin family protein [Polyangiaceae bacterium]|nr:imelysin family protein [Polyangiaceae bacterium]